MKIKHPITVLQASKRCGVTELAIWRFIIQGKIHCGINYKNVVINAEELQQFMQNNPQLIKFWRMPPEKRLKIRHPNDSWDLNS